MLAYTHAVRAAARRISGAINRSLSALEAGRVQQEPAMTDRMLASIEECLRDYHVRGITWEAMTLTDRGPASQESIYGADFLGVLDITLPEFKVQKGFLAQAKLVRGGSSGDLKILKEQCDAMLELSPDSFVFLYRTEGVRVVPAIAVLSSTADPMELYFRSAQRFFEEHLQCFIGDRKIDKPHSATLEKLRAKFQARSALLVKAHGQWP